MYPGVHARTNPDKPAVIAAETGAQLTYAELETESIRLARWLDEVGVACGDHVAILSDNVIEFYAIYWGVIRCGVYVTVINSHLTAEETAYIVDDSGARVLIAAAGLAQLAADVAGLVTSPQRLLAFGGTIDGYLDFAETVGRCGAEPRADEHRGIDMLYSSGTTGRPKGVKMPVWDTPLAQEPPDSLLGTMAGLGFGPQTVYLSPAPVYHAAPLRYSYYTQALGGTVVLMGRFDPEQALAAIEGYGVTHSQWVPTHFIRMLKLPAEVRARYDVSSLRCAIHAAAPCPVEVKRAMIDWWGPVVYEYYSSSEACGSTMIDSADWLRKPGSVGQDGRRGVVHICDDDGRELPPGEVGTIYFERPGWSFEYHNDPAKTASARHLDHEDWYSTGDVGYVDEDRFLFLTDRATFMIISGGVNIYPQEVENALSVHPDVFDVAVIGVSDPEMGQAVHAVVQLAPGVTPGDEVAEELREFARGKIAHYKCPRTIEFVAELPRTATGKLLKRKLIEQRGAA